MTTDQDIINFWYSDRIKKHWFSSTPSLDNEIRDSYADLWLTGLKDELDDWKNTASGCLALIILLDQFPLNMFRGEAKGFLSEKKSIEVAHFAISQGFDKEIDIEKLSFLIMPLMHSEDINDQDLSVALFAKHALTSNLKFAEHHRDIVKRFGRFPHRNEILGRESNDLERAYLNSKEAFKG